MTTSAKTAPMLHRVFVYGTLKRGFGNWSRFLKGRSHFAGEAVSPRAYRMVHVGFPVMLETEPTTDSNPLAVAGELYHVSDAVLRELDRLEGEGNMYHRKVIDVTENGVSVKAYVYIGDARYFGDRMPYTYTNKAGALDWHPDRAYGSIRRLA